jgi:tetratricopeptide (TPR) repeat protein
VGVCAANQFETNLNLFLRRRVKEHPVKVSNLGALLILIPLSGCTAFQTYSELHRGRVALLGGMPATAISHFEKVTALDERVRYSPLQEGGWTYLGRAHYDAKKYPEARKALERALAVNGADNFAKFYLGLTLARQENQETGRRQVLLGLQGLHESIDHIAYATPAGIYWDVTGQIRRDLQAAQGEVKGAGAPWDKLFDRLETLGTIIEQEIDLAGRDESRETNRRAGGSDS